MLAKQLSGAAAAAAPTDPDFEYVTLLLHGDGTNGGQNNTFIDSSSNNFTITRNGNTTQGSFSPNGTLWSNYFDGTGDYLVTPANAAFTFGTGDFTIECWVNSKSTPSYGFVWSVSSQTPSLQRYATNNTVLYSIGGAVLIASSAAVFDGLWHHVAVVKLSGVTTLYVDGVSQGTTSDATSLTGNTFYVGSWPGAAGYELNGYVSNIRVVKGTALYTSNFTPSTTPLTAVSGTSLLTCQSNRFIDNSSNNFALTVNGNTSVQRFSPFAPSAEYSTATLGGSGYFDASGDYLSAPSNTATTAGSGDFTVEAWVFLTKSTASMLFCNAVNSGLFFGWNFNSAGLGIGRANQAIDLQAPTPLPLNAWTHIAASRSGTTARLFVNGSQVASGTVTTNYQQGTVQISGEEGVSVNYKIDSAYVSQLRFVKGTAVYTTNFTPPAAPLTAISGTGLLLNFTNAAIFDNAMMNDLETVGNAQISTSVKKYGTGSIYVNGAGNYVQAGGSPESGLGTSNFTAECWVNTTSTYTYDGIFQIDGGTASDYSGIMVTLSGVFASYTGSGWDLFANPPLSFVNDGAWHHIALVRNGANLTLYKDGTATSAPVNIGTNPIRAVYPGRVWVGQQANAGSLVGYIDDFRISRVARYTGNFTPPAQAFPNT